MRRACLIDSFFYNLLRLLYSPLCICVQHFQRFGVLCHDDLLLGSKLQIYLIDWDPFTVRQGLSNHWLRASLASKLTMR
jgi:hypothetical protein